MENVLTDIQNHLLAKVPALKYVDENWGQLDYYAPHHPVKWPCALVDCFSASYENMGNKLQTGLATIQVIIADLKLSNSSGAAPDNQKQSSASFYTLMKNVYKALHGWAGHPHYSSLIRVSERRIKRDDGVRQHEILFTLQIKDGAAMPPKIAMPKPVSIIVQAELEKL